MYVAINAANLSSDRSGVGWFIYELLKNLSLTNGNRFTAFFNRNFRDKALEQSSLDIRHTRFLSADGLVSRTIWENLILPRDITVLEPDIFHGTAFSLPVFDLGIPQVVTVYDLAHLTLPGNQNRLFSMYLDWVIPQSCKRAAKVIAISEATRQDLVNLYNVPDSKIEVIYGGVAEHFLGPCDESLISQVESSLRLPQNYLLTVGDIHPRKNLITGTRVVYLLRKQGIDTSWVIAGKVVYPGYHKKVLSLIEQLGLKDQVFFAGGLGPDELKVVYANAQALLFPSYYEGFGLPAVESMACGTPVVSSNAGALSEVIGDAGITADPENAEEMADGVKRLIQDNALREMMIKHGKEQAAKFSWKEHALRTLEVYRSAI